MVYGHSNVLLTYYYTLVCIQQPIYDVYVMQDERVGCTWECVINGQSSMRY